jgi:hypothetical protein
VIDAICAMVPDSRSGRGSAWHAVAVVDGVTYEAASRSSAVAALCRELVAGGVPDGPIQITFDGVAGEMTVRSIHKFAGTTLSEGDASIRRVKWSPYQGASECRARCARRGGDGLIAFACTSGGVGQSQASSAPRFIRFTNLRRIRREFRPQAL